MKDSLWIVIAVTAVFVGFLIGYSLPPLIEVGMIGGGGGEKAELKSKLDQETQDYYRDLLEER